MCNGQAVYQQPGGANNPWTPGGNWYMWWAAWYWNTGDNSQKCSSSFYDRSARAPIFSQYGEAADIPYLSASNERKCPPCSLGNYCPVGSVAQQPCPVGWYCPTPSLAVICSNKPTALSYIGTGGTSATCPFGDTPSCPAGQYADIATSNCKDCAAGTYQPTVVTIWQPNCPLCPAGSYCPASGLSVAQTCPAGSYCPVSGAATPCLDGE